MLRLFEVFIYRTSGLVPLSSKHRIFHWVLTSILYLKLSSRLSKVLRKNDLIYKVSFFTPIGHNRRNENICLKCPFLGYFSPFLYVISIAFSTLSSLLTLISTVYIIRNLHFAVPTLLFWWLYGIISVWFHCLRRAKLIFSNLKSAWCSYTKLSHVFKTNVVSSPAVVKYFKSHIL